MLFIVSNTATVCKNVNHDRVKCRREIRQVMHQTSRLGELHLCSFAFMLQYQHTARRTQFAALACLLEHFFAAPYYVQYQLVQLRYISSVPRKLRRESQQDEDDLLRPTHKFFYHRQNTHEPTKYKTNGPTNHATPF